VGQEELGTRAELKNINSFKFIKDAINFEIDRQIELVESGGRVVQETRLYNPDKGETFAMRSKEESHDYRYFPEPDIPPIVVTDELLGEIRADLPEMPDVRRERFEKDFKLSDYDANLITEDRYFADFYEAIATFEGASKRLEKIADSDNTVIFKDYAHSPSKVEATTKAVKNQYQDKKLIACFELHTYSSLDSEFLSHYKNTLNAADEAVIFYSPKAIKIKGLKNIEPQDIRDAFQHKNVRIFTEGKEFVNYLKTLELKDAVLLLMSSGNYGGLDFDELKDWV
jgi:Glu-tRNA(Gln) amidotransferase subunit E-like FAD-binding protein